MKEVTQSIKDVPPKTFALTHVYTKGDTIRGTEILRNVVRQFNKPKGANVGTDLYVIIAVAWQKVRVDFVTRFPGGTVHAHGEGMVGSKPEVPIVGARASMREQPVLSRVNTSLTARSSTSIACRFPDPTTPAPARRGTPTCGGGSGKHS